VRAGVRAPKNDDGRADDHEREERSDVHHLAEVVDRREGAEERADASTIHVILKGVRNFVWISPKTFVGRRPSRDIAKKTRVCRGA